MYYVIINPASRSGKGLKLWKEIVEPALKQEGVAYRPYFSEKAGDVTRLVKEITENPAIYELEGEKRPRLMILGGDGTMNEALQGLQDSSRVVLGYIPTGSSNDLARDLGIPRDPVQALDRILHTGTIHSMDMGILTTRDGTVRRFADSCGIGFDAAVCDGVSHSKVKGFLNKLKLGKLSYLAIALKQLFSAKEASCMFSLDGCPPIQIHHFLFNACMIHRYEGGGFQFCPKANDHDGVMDLCAVGGIPKLVILFALPTAFFGKHYLFRGVDGYQASQVQIRASVPLCVHTDGEIVGYFTDLRVDCVKEALSILC